MEILANCAASADGKLATRERAQNRLSGPDDMARVHRLRHRVDAVAVGVGTLLADDPKLTVKARHLEGADPSTPLKVILDSRCRTPAGCEAIATPGDVLVACTEGRERSIDGAEVRAFGRDAVDLDLLLGHLDKRGVGRLLVEGGGEVLASFLLGGYVDRWTVYLAPVVLGGRDAPTLADGLGVTDLGDAAKLRLADVERIDDGVLLSWERP